MNAMVQGIENCMESTGLSMLQLLYHQEHSWLLQSQHIFLLCHSCQKHKGGHFLHTLLCGQGQVPAFTSFSCKLLSNIIIMTFFNMLLDCICERISNTFLIDTIQPRKHTVGFCRTGPIMTKITTKKPLGEKEGEKMKALFHVIEYKNSLVCLLFHDIPINIHRTKEGIPIKLFETKQTCSLPLPNPL